MRPAVSISCSPKACSSLAGETGALGRDDPAPARGRPLNRVASTVLLAFFTHYAQGIEATRPPPT